jgi:hypothetical protein
MRARKIKLFTSTMLPLAVAFGVAGGTALVMTSHKPLRAAEPERTLLPQAQPKPQSSQMAQAGGCGPCSPCAASSAAVPTDCYVPRLRNAAAGSPCRPSSPCNPCAATNPCAAANPCSPCGAGNPCAVSASAGLSDAEALAAYDCVLEALGAAYAKSGLESAVSYQAWDIYSTAPYGSATHGGLYVHNYANEAAEAYGAFENAGVMPEGAKLAKDSFRVTEAGAVQVGPLFIMEKMGSGFSPASNDWRYTMVLPDGTVAGSTGGEGSGKMQFCADCHLATASDSMMFIPEKYRSE